ncbi:Nif11-like leader peptide family natural product precursor [Phormidesmis sp. 146-35]
MSVESATRFLKAVAQDESIRERFEAVRSPEDFLKISDQLGYCFTTAELKEIVAEQSKGVVVRRSTGVWKWLRNINWLERQNVPEYSSQELAMG